MNNSSIYNRTNDLKKRLNEFIQSLTLSKKDYFEELTQNELIRLKSALSDINNVLTLKTTLAFTEWLCDFFQLKQIEKEALHHQINTVKPNTNGFDIEINSTHKVVVEIKCIIPINRGHYYGAAQRNSILDDAIKLKHGKKTISNTSDFFKIIGLIDLGEKTDQAINTLVTPSKSIRTQNKSRIKRHKIIPTLKVLDNSMTVIDLNTENIFIKKIKL